MDIAKSIKDKERNGVSKVVIIDKDSSDQPLFWEILGRKADIASAAEGMKNFQI